MRVFDGDSYVEPLKDIFVFGKRNCIKEEMKEQFSPVQVNIGSPSREGLYKGLSRPSFYRFFSRS